MNDSAIADPAIPQPATPEQRRRADRLGLILGLVALGLTAGFIAIFTLHGLPKDPTEYKRLQQDAQSRPASTEPSR